MITAERISFSYPGTSHNALSDVSLTIKDRAWICVTGSIGSGKTTLCKTLKGMFKPDAGHVRFLESHTGFSDVAYLGGDPYDTLVGISVEEDIAFGMENLGFPRSEMQSRVKHALMWTELEGMEKRLVNTLSGGEQQKLVLAGALATGARVLILDEATNMLDRPVRKSVRALINSLRHERGLAILEVTHNPEDLMLADRVILMRDGAISFNGNYPEVLLDPLCVDWLRAGWGLAGLRRELALLGVSVPDCMDNSLLSDCLLKVVKK